MKDLRDALTLLGILKKYDGVPYIISGGAGVELFDIILSTIFITS
ncbi:hypothetical protein [Thermotoga sp.]|nr:hypothetical protein [Thermotoga sp.]